MMVEPKPPPAAVPAPPQECVNCRYLIAPTETGWTHIDTGGADAGWMCPPPHMTLAAPAAPPVEVVGQAPDPSPGPPASPPNPTRAQRLTEIPPSPRRDPQAGPPSPKRGAGVNPTGRPIVSRPGKQ